MVLFCFIPLCFDSGFYNLPIQYIAYPLLEVVSVVLEVVSVVLTFAQTLVLPPAKTPMCTLHWSIKIIDTLQYNIAQYKYSSV